MGTADAMIAGGTEAAITELTVASFTKMRVLSKNNDSPTLASRPFDLHRDGFVIGEGAGIVILEEYEHARNRGAHIYAELVGYGVSADAHHITRPDPDGAGMARCMAQAIQMGRIDLDEVDYINAHGTATQANDASESAAIERVFGNRARQLSISSTKGVTGHCLGAAGGIEAVYTALTVSESLIPPTANYVAPDPACRLDYTPNQPREREVRVAISTSAGFGGTNACLAMRKPT
jgi:3-oxoacyl-[acyl-carrier-protein] synthase II